MPVGRVDAALPPRRRLLPDPRHHLGIRLRSIERNVELDDRLDVRRNVRPAHRSWWHSAADLLEPESDRRRYDHPCWYNA